MLAFLGKFSQVLVSFVKFWQVLASFGYGRFWQFFVVLAGVDRFRQVLVSFGFQMRIISYS